MALDVALSLVALATALVVVPLVPLVVMLVPELLVPSAI